MTPLDAGQRRRGLGAGRREYIQESHMEENGVGKQGGSMSQRHTIASSEATREASKPSVHTGLQGLRCDDVNSGQMVSTSP